MDNMSGDHAVEVGIAGDYSEASMRFIRLWDKPGKYPATSANHILEFKHLIHVLFVQGYILCMSGDPGDADDFFHGDGESRRALERFGATAGTVAERSRKLHLSSWCRQRSSRSMSWEGRNGCGGAKTKRQ